MRTLVLFMLAAGVSSPAFADRHTVPVADFGTLPAPCRTVATIPRDAQTPTPGQAANISVASCTAIVKVRALRLSPTPASVAAIDDAIRPSLALLEEVIQTGDPEQQIVALHAKGDLLNGAAVYLRASVRPLAPNTVGKALALHDAEVERASELSQPWRDQAASTFRRVAELAPQVEDEIRTDPVLAFVVSDSALQEGATIATL